MSRAARRAREATTPYRMPVSPIVTAAAWMSGTLISFMAMAVAGRELAGELNTFQILFFRSLVGVVVIGLIAWRAGVEAVRPHSFGVHLVRNSVHFVGQLGWFYGIAFLPLADVFAIEFTTPVWTAVLAVFLLGEGMTKSRAMAIGLGFLGILIILRPGLEIVNFAALAVLIGAVVYATSHTLTKRLTRDNAALGILFYMTLLQLPMGLVPSLFDWVWPSTPNAWFWVFVVGTSALGAHYCMARALALADATVVVPMDFLRLPLIALVGFAFYAEAVDIWLFLGAGVILAGTLQNLHAERSR